MVAIDRLRAAVDALRTKDNALEWQKSLPKLLLDALEVEIMKNEDLSRRFQAFQPKAALTSDKNTDLVNRVRSGAFPGGMPSALETELAEALAATDARLQDFEKKSAPARMDLSKNAELIEEMDKARHYGSRISDMESRLAAALELTDARVRELEAIILGGK